jgi:hypothetical protein
MILNFQYFDIIVFYFLYHYIFNTTNLHHNYKILFIII